MLQGRKEEKAMGIQIEKLKIDSEFKEKINKTFSRKNLEITYFNGYIVKFNKCNIESISPHKILFSSPTKNLIVLHYADYMENDGLYFVDGESEPLTITKLRDYVRNYF